MKIKFFSQIFHVVTYIVFLGIFIIDFSCTSRSKKITREVCIWRKGEFSLSRIDRAVTLFQKGDIIDVVQMNKSGLWKGVVHNRIGHFKFINVEILNDRVPRRGEPERGKWSQRYRQKPGSVQELLQRMNLQVERQRDRVSERAISLAARLSNKLIRICMTSNAK